MVGNSFTKLSPLKNHAWKKLDGNRIHYYYIIIGVIYLIWRESGNGREEILLVEI